MGLKVHSTSYLNHLQIWDSFAPKWAFNVKVGPCVAPMSFRDECIRAARLIEQDAKSQAIYICMSGGIDSEMVASCFQAAGVSIKAAIMRFSDDLNKHDIKYAEKFCSAHNIPIEYFDLDPLKFLNSNQHLVYAQKYNCSSPMFACHIWLAEQIQGYSVMSGNPLRLVWEGHQFSSDQIGFSTDLNQLSYFEGVTENQFALDNFFFKSGKRGVSNFFLHTPELIMSGLLMLNPFEAFSVYASLAAIETKYKSSQTKLYSHYSINNILKIKLYYCSGFDIHLRPNKYTGFEKIHQLMAPPESDGKSEIDRMFMGLLEFNRKFREPMKKLAPQAARQGIYLGSANVAKIHEKIPLWLKERPHYREWFLRSFNVSQHMTSKTI